jgi:hypothetical protein
MREGNNGNRGLSIVKTGKSESTRNENREEEFDQTELEKIRYLKQREDRALAFSTFEKSANELHDLLQDSYQTEGGGLDIGFELPLYHLLGAIKSMFNFHKIPYSYDDDNDILF